jgi:prepilin peptidase dependent protein B
MLKKQIGFSLIELMIVLLVSSIILLGVLRVVASILNNSATTLQKQRLMYELDNVLDVMSRDIERAGYWKNAINDIKTGANSNPYMSTTVLNVVNSSCILLGYDINNDGILPSQNSGGDDERYGFRYDDTNQAVAARLVSSNYGCTSPTGWEDITDNHVLQVSGLTFSDNTSAISITGSPSPTLHQRKITIAITGSLTQNPGVSLSLQKSINVYNSQFVP